MRATSWRSLTAATVALIAGVNAQTTDLGTLLSGQKNLTTFYGLIQVCCGGLQHVQHVQHVLTLTV
jgi:hypothetical protein